MKNIFFVSAFLFLFSTLSAAAPPCFSWNKFNDAENITKSFMLLSSPIINGEITVSSIEVAEIPITTTFVCATSEPTTQTAYWMVTVGDFWEGEPSNAVVYGPRKPPELPKKPPKINGFYKKTE